MQGASAGQRGVLTGSQTGAVALQSGRHIPATHTSPAEQSSLAAQDRKQIPLPYDAGAQLSPRWHTTTPSIGFNMRVQVWPSRTLFSERPHPTRTTTTTRNSETAGGRAGFEQHGIEERTVSRSLLPRLLLSALPFPSRFRPMFRLDGKT